MNKESAQTVIIRKEPHLVFSDSDFQQTTYLLNTNYMVGPKYPEVNKTKSCLEGATYPVKKANRKGNAGV